MMKKFLIAAAAAALSLCLAVPGNAQGIEFAEQPKWEEALEAARQQDKYIFMDCYTTWCGPCKRLASEVFTAAEVGEFFNANFINVKYDMEKGEGKELNKRYKDYIIGYPTLLLIDGEGRVVHQMAGFKRPKELIEGMKAGMEGRSLAGMRVKYENGDRSMQLMTAYRDALEEALLKKEVNKVMDDYLRALPLDSLLSPSAWKLAGNYVKDPYSPQFEFVVYNFDKYYFTVKADCYKLETQLVDAIQKAQKQITSLQVDEKGNILPLVRDDEKERHLLRLLERANLKRSEMIHATFYIHDLKLAGDWNGALDNLSLFHRLRIFGYSNDFAIESVRYIGHNTKDKAILAKCIALTESIQQQEDSRGTLGSNHYNTLAQLYTAAGDRKKAAEAQAVYDKRQAETEALYQRYLDGESLE